ncbi:ABC transporter permease [Streptomyces sp. NPDC000594]|uniref:ABC transporter permease n=1 Tax=Streptomyces sp. NPDC000594 TaxID=3154261 RepID=UPI00332B004A
MTRNSTIAGPTAAPQGPGSTARRTTATGRLAALGRAELTLLVRNRSALFVALLMPLIMMMAIQGSMERIDEAEAGMSIAEASLTGGIGMILILVVHMNLVSAYVARREDLVLKRLRTGEVSDTEVLTGTALPAVGIALTQCVLLVAAGVVLMDVGAPDRPELLAAGIVLGVLVCVALAAVISSFTRTVESAQLTTMPMFLLSLGGSGLLVPLTVMPEGMARICELLPLTGVMTLVRAGWLGGVEGRELTVALVGALVWAAVSVFAVQRWFRWEPRR